MRIRLNVFLLTVVLGLGGCSVMSAGVDLASGAVSTTGLVAKGTTKVVKKTAGKVTKTVIRKKKR